MSATNVLASPADLAIIERLRASDEGTFMMLYFDERGVSRHYEVSMDDGVMHWWRDAEGFRQRYTVTMSAAGDTMHGRGELARDEDAWGPDLELTYTRVK